MKALFAVIAARRRVASGAVGFLGRLRRDRRGNVLALMAAMLIPLASLSGAAVDMGRLYAVKTRLQQACDAGVLAGRKFLAASDSSTIDSNAAQQAQSFFGSNFKTGWFSVSAVTFVPLKTTENQVSGTAIATVPMTLMRLFGIQSKTVSVTCEARYDVADADVMFVLDTTGSMACLTSDSQSTCDSYAVSNVVTNGDGSYSVTEKTGSRISGLRSAVAKFYTTLTSQADTSTHFRFGFMPYSATTNVGALLPRNYLATTTWPYQTRVVVETNNGSPAPNTTTNTTQDACNAKLGHSYATNSGASTPYTGKITTLTSWTSASGGTCVTSVQQTKVAFDYKKNALDVTAYIGSLTSGAKVPNPDMVDAASNAWSGCVEERKTSASSSFTATSPPLDLDVDTAPYDEDSRWGPMWGDVVFAHSTSTYAAELNKGDYRTRLTRYQYNKVGNTNEYAHLYNELPCPKPAQRLKTMSIDDINAYLAAANGFRPYGVTYHDGGMTWGTRLLSPNGIFAGDTAPWPGHNAPNRYIVFLTDGTMEPDAYAYTTHGIEQWDGRVTNGSPGNLTSYHNKRFAAACQIAKNHNITIFVIAYAQTMTDELKACASPSQSYYASDATGLNTAFSKIAQQVAMLRISK